MAGEETNYKSGHAEQRKTHHNIKICFKSMSTCDTWRIVAAEVVAAELWHLNKLKHGYHVKFRLVVAMTRFHYHMQ